MNQYKGTFKDMSDNDIFVEIIPTGIAEGQELETVQLRFPHKEPVVIATESDGIFSPLKPASATIKVFTENIYWDLYTPYATGYYTHVYTGDGLDLFAGYLTPCVYSQDYVYKSEIELEAVDYIAVLKQFIYKTKTDKRDILSVSDILANIFDNLPVFGGYTNNTKYNFDEFYLQESNFFDDDDEPMSCQEILEELFTYLGVTATMADGTIIIQDYDYNMLLPEQLTTSKYGKGNPTVELDEVYNKINFSANLYEIENLTDEVFDDKSKTIINELKTVSSGTQFYSDFYFSWRQWNHKTKDKNRYTMMVKPYTFQTSTSNDKSYIKSRWKTYTRRISDLVLETVSLEEKSRKDCNLITDDNGQKLFVPYYIGAYPIRQYTFNKEEGIENKTSISWENYILFPAFDYEHKDEDMTRQSYPALTFESDEEIAYSLLGGMGYVLFDAKIWCQSQDGIDGGPDRDIIWATAKGDKTIAVPCCMDNMGFKVDHQLCAIRGKNSEKYNNGWPLVKAQLQIGEKYWDGSIWTTTETTFFINYHDDNVSVDKETFNYYTWLKVANNPSVQAISVGQDGYAIPIKSTDKLSGKLKFTLYTPEPVAKNFKPTNFVDAINTRGVNNYFMKDLKLKYVYKDSQHWADDVKTDDDIVYTHTIDDYYSTEMEEIELKINSWYKDKPISKSYILDKDKLPVVWINGAVQEWNLVDKYYRHYSTPKKILSLYYKTKDIHPAHRFYHTQTDTTYVIDTYEMDVKTGNTQLKLTEL